MTKPVAMTELEAVNVLLTTIGEAPVNTLTGKQTTDVAIAQQVLNEVNREVQSRGWHFNTEYDVELIPDTSKNITPPADAVRVDVENMDTVIRNNKLFNLETRKNTFEDKLKAQIIYLQDFEVIPEPARRYIATRAARIFSDRMLNSESMNRFLVQDEQSALIDLKEFEGDTAKHSMMDSYSVARVLNRGHRRILL